MDQREGRPLFLLSGDQIWIGKSSNSLKTFGMVQHVSSNEIRMKIQATNGIVQQQPIYSIHFMTNRLAFKLQRLALETAKNMNIIDLLFPQQNQLDLLKKSPVPQ